MCGIFGVFGATLDPNWMTQCSLELKHRGPDNCETFLVSGEIHLGTTRLAMVDPHPRSNQPMVDSDSKDILCLNGEVYNYLELKKQLESTGVVFETESDTEVLLKLLSRKGVEAISEIKGMFAFAFYSRKEQTLYLCRDRLGKKPLYFYLSSTNFYWSSEITPLRKIDGSNELNINAIVSILSLGYTIDPDTISNKIISVRPGETLEIKHQNGLKPVVNQKQIAKWYQPKKENSLLNALDSAILLRVGDHDKVALSLSGGLDSSIIAIRLKALGVPFTAFSAFWSDSDKKRYNEDAEVAEELCKKLSVPFERVEMPKASEIPMDFAETQVICGEPISNPTALSMVRLYKEISSNGFRLVLTGDGSDEFFGGYARHIKTHPFRKLAWINSRNVDLWTSSGDKEILRKLRFLLATQVAEPKLSLNLFWHEIFTIKEISKLLCMSKRKVFSSLSRSIGEGRLIAIENGNNVQSIMNFDQEIWLSSESNRKLDRISMHFSTEARSPFQDDDLIGLSIKLMKDCGYNELNKTFLRREFDTLEKLGVRKDKAGFISPAGHWIRNNRSFFQGLVLDAEELLTVPAKISFAEKFDYYVAKHNFKVNQKIWTLACLGYFLKRQHSGIKKDTPELWLE